MLLNKRRRWALVAGVSGALAAQAAERVLASSWRLATRKDPPKDPAYSDVDWKSAIIWTAAAGSAVALARLASRHGASVAWKRVTGTRPPRRRRRRHINSMREAFI
jgi:hypothetical protein